MRRPRNFVALAVTCFISSAIASTTLGGQSVTVSQVCTKAASALQHCSPSQATGTQSLCCNATRILQDLGCFCLESTKESSRSAVSPNVWAALPSCKLQQTLDFSSCNASNGATVLPGVPGVFRVPGKGLVQVSALEDALAGNASASPPPSRLARDLTSEQPEFLALDTRPVMDLSAIADDVSVIFSSDGEADMTVTVTDGSGSSGDTSVSLDLDLPAKMLADGMDLDLEVVDSDLAKEWDGISFTMDVDMSSASASASDITLEIDGDLPSSLAVTYTSETASGLEHELVQSFEVSQDGESLFDDLELGMEVSDEELIRQLTEADAVDRTFSMELDVAVSKGLVHSIEGASDVTVELGVDVLNDGTLSETAITIERDSQALPLSGQGLGSILIEAAEWLSAFLPVPLTDLEPSGQVDEMANALGEALQLMSEVGEEISERIPEEQLQAGDTIEVLLNEGAEGKVQWGDRIEFSQGTNVGVPNGGAQLLSRRALDSLSAAVKSALYTKQAEQKVQRQAVCSVCQFVNRHQTLLWGLVYLNISLLWLCCCAAFFQRYRARTRAVPTVPESDLETPLIINAADFAEPGLSFSKQMLLAPVWEPASKLGQQQS